MANERGVVHGNCELRSIQSGQKVGTGECFDFTDQALKNAGAKSAENFGKVTTDADYFWGEQVTVDKTLAEEIIQFRDYSSDVTKEKKIALALPGD